MYWCQSVLLKNLVGFREMPAPEKSAVGGEGRGVRGGEHVVFGGVDQLDFGLCVRAPEEEHDAAAFLGEAGDGGVGEGLPAVPLVRAGLVRPYRQGGVEQQHALPRPAVEVASQGDGHPDVGMQLLEDVDQRGRELYAGLHRETESVGLPRLVVRVLPENHHLHLVKRREVEGVENLRTGRKDGKLLFLCHQEALQLLKVGRGKLVGQLAFPRFFNDRIDHRVGLLNC